MDRNGAFALTIAASALVAAQAPINSHLGKAIGTFQAAFISFAIGTLALVVVVSFAGGFGQIHLTSVPWYYLTGGLLGAAYVTTVLVTVRSLGAGGVVAATIAGQLTLSVVVDQFGWLGVDREPITLARLAGIALLALGVFLIVRD